MHLPLRVTTVLGTVGCLLATTACGGTEIGQPMAPGSQLVVSITQKADTVAPGATRQLFAMVTDSYGAAQPHTVTWSSSMPSVATVSS
jgi:Bacterial Ig-like domain (group 2)